MTPGAMFSAHVGLGSFGEEAGGAAGGAYGGSVGGPAGAIVGAYVGSLAGGKLESLLGSIVGGSKPCSEDPFCVLSTNVDTWRSRCAIADAVDAELVKTALWQQLSADPTLHAFSLTGYVLNGIRAGLYQTCACEDGDCAGDATPPSGGGSAPRNSGAGTVAAIVVGGGAALTGLFFLAKKLRWIR